MNDLAKISVITLGYNHKQVTLECLHSLKASDYPIHQIIYVDNNSSDGAVVAVKNAFSDVQIVSNDKNLLFAAGMNSGFRVATGDIIFCLGNDTIVHKDCIKEISLAMQDKSIGCANAKMLRYGTNNLDTSINRLGFMGVVCYTVDYGKEDKGQCDNLIPEYVCGGAMVVRKAVLEEVGLYDELFPLFWQDVDLSLRIKKAGYKLGFIPKAVVWHRGGYTSRTMNWRAKLDINTGRVKLFLKYLTRAY